MAAMPRKVVTTIPAVVAGLLLAGCGADPDRGADGTEPPGGEDDADPAYVVRRVETGQMPCGILGAGGRVWVSNYADDTLVWVDPATGEVSAPVPTGDQPCGLAYGAGSIWVEDFGSDEVTRVSATDGTVEATYRVGSQPFDVTFAEGAAWVTDYGSGTVSRIDAASGEVAATEVGGQPTGIAPAGGKLWVGLQADGIVSLDPRSGAVLDRLPTDGPAGWTAYDEDRVWVNVGSTVVRLDPASAQVVATVSVGDKPADGTLVGDEVWVGDKDRQLYRFSADATGGAATSVDSTLFHPFVAAELDGLLWVADFQGTEVVTIDPAEVPD